MIDTSKVVSSATIKDGLEVAAWFIIRGIKDSDSSFDEMIALFIPIAREQYEQDVKWVADREKFAARMRESESKRIAEK